MLLFNLTSCWAVIHPERCDDECFSYPSCPLISQIVDNPFGNLLTSTWFLIHIALDMMLGILI